MFGKGKKTALPAELVLRAPETHRDPIKRGLANQRVRVLDAPKMKRQVKVRRSLPIRAYIGPNGHGKSLAAVYDLMGSLDRGRLVLSTVPLLDWRAVPDPELYVPVDNVVWTRDVRQPLYAPWAHRDSGALWRRPLHPNYRRLTEWSELMEADDCDVLLDDVAGVASSRQSSGMPAAIEKLLQKLRHDDITLIWTAPAWARADLVIRETTQAVTVCEGSRPETKDAGDRLWKENRLFDWTTYDARAYTDWTEGKREKAKRLCFQRYWRPGKDAMNAYDSLGKIDTITSVTDAGRCVACGGTRRAPACTCDDYVARVAESAERGRSARKRSAHGPERDGDGHEHSEHSHELADAS